MFRMTHRATWSIGVLAMLVLGIAACAPAATPSPTAVPAKPAATTAPAKPAATSAPAKVEAKPAASPAAKAEAKPAASPAAAAKPADIKVPKPSGSLAFKMGHSAEKQISYLGELITTERLNKEGWQIEDVYFAQSEMNAEATAKGDVHMSLGVSNSAMLAHQKAGVQQPMLAEWTRNDWIVVAKKGITKCQDLNGKKVAYHSEGAVSTAMLKQWVNSECAGTKPDYLVISGSNNRANAIMNGQIDATPLFFADWVKIDQQRPGEFPIMRTFADGLPNLMPNTYVAYGPWLEKNQPVAIAYFAELLKTHRAMQADPRVAEDAAKRHFSELDQKTISAILKVYNDINGFPPNGGLTPEKVQGTIKFFEEAGVIKPGLTVEQVSNPKILEGALAIVGKAPGKP